jgi:MarR family transcriptional regulator for hemolysin
MEKLNDIIFYHLDKAIKTYRQFAQSELKQAGIGITIDQWIVLKSISENPGISQRAIAENVFKDEASVTRIIELLVKKKLLTRSFHDSDRRKVELTSNRQTTAVLKKIHAIAVKNRALALLKVSSADLQIVRKVMIRIADNCREKS